MVLRDRNRSQEPQSATMASDQPLKKKQRIDAPDLDHPFITELPSEDSPDSSTMSEDAVDCSLVLREDPTAMKPPADGDFFKDVSHFQEKLMAQCLCGVDEDKLQSLMLEAPKLQNWSTEKVLQYLSTLQLFLDVYLRQNAPGKLCTAVKSGGDALIHLEHSTQWFTSVLSLSEHRSPFVTFLAGRVVSSFLIVAKDNVDHDWLRRIVDNMHAVDSLDCVAVQKINFSLDVIKRIIEWKDVEQHPVEDSAYINTANPVAESSMNPHNLRTILAGDVSDSDDDDIQTINSCETIVLTDSESFDTSHVKCLTINALQHHWPILVRNVKLLLTRYLNLTNAENCILTFLSLWENTISIKANLSVVDTKPFYADLQSFVELLRSTELPPLIYTQLLSLYNEVLCYGSTLALQDLLPDETCTLAHAIVRFVKDFRLLNEIHIRNSLSGLGFIGLDSPVVSTVVETTVRQKDVTMLQKLTLLILKSVAVTVKEMRCDSSDSSIDSTDYNAIQDMQMVERSIRDVLKKLDTFMKNALEFHPETPFTQVLVRLFSEQDDYLIESMVCTLDITIGLVYRNSVYPDLIPMLNPFLTFVEFLRIVSYDHKVLLDYLVSNETCFLLYLLRFLKYVRRNWSAFFETCQQACERGIDGTMAVLIRLRLQISRLVAKSRFPYNISPILRLLEVCENLYEGNDLS